MVKTPPLPDLSSLTHAQKDELILTLFARLAALESKVYKDSHNSSKSPSSDGPAKKTRSLRKRSKKKAGGQAGHPGTNLKPLAEPDRIVPHPLPTQCERCHLPLPQDGARVAQRRQVIDIALTPCEVVEHQVLEQVCQCGQAHVSAFPPAVTEPVQYGPNLKAFAVHLTQGQLLPYARAAQLIADLYGVAPSPGTLVRWVSEASGLLQDTADLIARHLCAAPVLHADESGLRVSGGLLWLHLTATETHTWYGIHAKRGMTAMVAHGILPKYLGVLVHDCWAPYWKLDCLHALCNAHLLRELVYIQELTGQTWPTEMSDFLCFANRLVAALKQREITLDAEQMAAFVTLYEGILWDGEHLNPAASRVPGKRGRVKQSPAFNLLLRMRQHADAVLLFIHRRNVPFTNNVGELAVRMPKVKQKISGCFRSPDGAQRFAVIRSCLDTLRKQGHRMLHVLRHAFAGNPIQPACG